MPVRLVDGPTNDSGRIEVYDISVDQWFIVCHNLWSDEDAQVVCSELGHEGGVAVGRSIFGDGSLIVGYSDMQCDGDENSLLNCSHNSNRPHTNCDESMVAGVFCGKEYTLHVFKCFSCQQILNN